MATYIVKPNQNIFDISIQLYGTIEGVFDLLMTNQWLNMNTDLSPGMQLEYHENYVLNDGVVSSLSSENITPANGERNVYHKEAVEPLIAYCDIDAARPKSSLIIGGEGIVVIDWGDNSELERIILSLINQEVEHYFNNTVETRRIKVYANPSTTKVSYLNTSNLGGSWMTTQPIVVDEYTSQSNGFSLSGLFLFEGTYKIDLQQCNVSSLLPIGDMDLQELDLTEVHFVSVDVLDEYLAHIATNYGTRRGCKVLLDTEPSETGWEAIRKILSEEEWNTPTPWQFIINGITHTFNNA